MEMDERRLALVKSAFNEAAPAGTWFMQAMLFDHKRRLLVTAMRFEDLKATVVHVAHSGTIEDDETLARLSRDAGLKVKG